MVDASQQLGSVCKSECHQHGELELLINAPLPCFSCRPASTAVNGRNSSLLKQRTHCRRRHNFAPARSLIITQQQIAGRRRHRRRHGVGTTVAGGPGKATPPAAAAEKASEPAAAAPKNDIAPAANGHRFVTLASSTSEHRVTDRRRRSLWQADGPSGMMGASDDEGERT